MTVKAAKNRKYCMFKIILNELIVNDFLIIAFRWIEVIDLFLTLKQLYSIPDCISDYTNPVACAAFVSL